jgi:O-antigen/teichoic acid export membrane protein
MRLFKQKFELSFLKDVSVLTMGSVIGQIINVCSYILFARWFLPSEFGIFGVFLAIQIVLAEIVNGKLDIAVMLPEEGEDTRKLVQSAIILGCAFSLICIPIVFIAGLLIPDAEIYYLLVVSSFSIAFIQPLSTLINKWSKYEIIAKGRIVQAVGNIGVGVGFYYLKVPINILVTAYVAAIFFHAVYLIIHTKSYWAPNFKFNKAVVRRYSRFPVFSTWSSMINNITRQLPFFILKPYFGADVVGQYTLANRVLQSPFWLLSNAINQVFYRDASLAKTSEELTVIWKRTVSFSLMTGVVPSLIILFFSEPLFRIFFGAEWQMAALISKILIFWVLMGHIAQPVSSVIDIYQKLKWELIFNTLFFVLRLTGLLIAVRFENVYLAVGVVTVLGVLYNFIHYLYVRKLVFTERNL